MFLLIFATAVASIAADFGYSNWTDLMPYGVGAFFMFGLGALPAGRLGDMWGRRVMMIIFFAGMGVSAILVALTQNAWQLAGALVVLGSFAAIYHPVGIPMLVANTKTPGRVIGFNGLTGNLGIALAAIKIGQKPADDRRTFGYRRFEILAAAFNATTGAPVWVQRFNPPTAGQSQFGSLSVGPGGARVVVVGFEETAINGNNWVVRSLNTSDGTAAWTRTKDGTAHGSTNSTRIAPNISSTPASFAGTSVKPIQLPMKLSGVERRIA